MDVSISGRAVSVGKRPNLRVEVSLGNISQRGRVESPAGGLRREGNGKRSSPGMSERSAHVAEARGRVARRSAAQGAVGHCAGQFV